VKTVYIVSLDCYGEEGLHGKEQLIDMQTRSKEKNYKEYHMERNLVRSETWTLLLADRKRLEAFEVWIWKRTKRVSWKNKVTNVNVLQKLP